MKRLLLLFALLLLLWLSLSGHYNVLFIGLGVVSSATAVLLAQRMGIVDTEGLPLKFLLGLAGYAPWLFFAIVRANFDVIRRILHPRLPIAPTVFRVPSTQRTAVGQVSYANSITLTPGTISLEVRGGEIEVHALSAEAAESLSSGEMARRIAAMEPE